MKKYWKPILMWIIFESVAITLWLMKGNLFYLLNFSYIGLSISLGLFLFIRKYKHARRVVQLLVGSYMLVYLGLICRENMQIEGFWYYLFTGVFDELNVRPIEALRATGCSRAAVLARAVWPASRAALGAAALYRFDVNLREASVMGLVGAGGIGTTLLFSMNGCNWPSAGACLIGLSVTVLAADAVSSRLRKRALAK